MIFPRKLKWLKRVVFKYIPPEGMSSCYLAFFGTSGKILGYFFHLSFQCVMQFYRYNEWVFVSSPE